MKRRVVITGIGPVTGIGIGKDVFFESILKGTVNVRKIPEAFENKHKFKSKHYVEAPIFSLSDYGISQAYESIMEEISRISAVGAKLALDDAGFAVVGGGKQFKAERLEDAAVILGVGMSSLQTALNSYLAHIFGSDKSVLEKLDISARYNRMVIPMLMPNSASAWISIIFGIKGPSYTVNASCASGTYAIGEAYRRIADGYCSIALTGGVECLKEKEGAIMRGFDMLMALTKSDDGNPIPFSKNRSGFLFNEGAGCVLVLEELDSAKQRGAEIYAEICGFESCSDAYNIVQIEESGEAIARMLEKLVGKNKIDYFNAHGTGTIANDEIEANIIQRVFGKMSEQPLINSTKGIIGHSIGASGAIEAAVTALSIKNSKVHGNNIVEPMEDLNLVQETINKDIDCAVSASYGFGGHNAAILFKRYTI